MPPRVAPIDPASDPSSPYYVHSSDGPSSVKVSPPLTGSNYHSWSRSMRRALVSDSIAQSIVFMENAIDVWNDLKERFSQADLVRIAELQQELHSLKQDSRSVTEFYSDLKLIWEELEIYLPMSNCSCRNRCTCESMRSTRANHFLLYIIRFLTGLNENFAVVKSQILLMDPLPPMNKVFSLVLQHERQGKFSPSDDSNVLLNAAKSKGSFPSKTTRVCTLCGKDNHIVENCFKKYGTPPHFRKNSQANSAEIEGGNDEQSTAANSNFITQDQALQLISLLQNSFPSQASSSAASNQVGSVEFTSHTSVNQGMHSQFFKTCSLGNWIVDSGASHHMCSSIQCFHSYSEIIPIKVRLPNGNVVLAKHSGVVKFSDSLVITNVLCIPNFSVNLISVSQLCKIQNYKVHFTDSKCTIQDQLTKRMIGSADLIEGLYYLTLTSEEVHAHNIDGTQHTNIPDQALWLFRLGHTSNTKMSLLQSVFPFIAVDNKGVCDICHLAKHKKLYYKVSMNKAYVPYELIHFDIWGPIASKSIHNHAYFLTVVDDYSRFTWVTLMKHKTEARQHVINFIKLIETQHNSKVKIVRTDNGVEFLITQFYASKGIIHQTSCVETPEQNGRVERKHQHLLNVGRALLFQAHLPKFFWSYDVQHATYIINRVPFVVLSNKSPYELLHNVLPNIKDLKVFGSLAYASTLQSHRTKLAPRARKCIFLGYKQGVKGTILYDLHNKEIFISRNVTHHDHILSYKPQSDHLFWHFHTSSEPTNVPETTHTSFNSGQPVNISTPHEHVTVIEPPQNLSNDVQPIEPSDITEPSHMPDICDTQCTNHNDTLNQPAQPLSPLPISDHLDQSSALPTSPDSNPTHRSTRLNHAPSYLSDYVSNQSTTSPGTKSSSGSLYPISDYHSLKNLSSIHHAFTVSLTHNTEPKSYLEACKFECWQKAMDDELEALTKTGTWVIVDLPSHIKPIGSKWVYKVKYKADGTIERYKVRLVAKGYNQVEGLDFFDTFSPVAKLTTVRLLLAIASIKGWFLHQLDVNNAFLHGELQEDVYMAIPEGVTTLKQNQVCKLQKSLYGLKQASRKWYEKLTSLLISEGYSQSTADYSLFTIHNASHFTALLIYVDDIILAGTDLNEITRIKEILDTHFKIKDLGVLKYFLGLEVAQSREGIAISQRKYCLDLLKDYGLLGSKPASTPLDPAVKLHIDDNKPYENLSLYRRQIGKLFYLCNTRPDISFATQQLSQFLHKPSVNHYHAACRAKKQTTVSRSSSETEYRALSSATCELIWLTYLMNDLKVQCSKLPVIYCDSQSDLHIASNPVFHERTKHLEIDCHLVREKVQQGILILLPIPTEEQLADCLTKSLAAPKFNELISKLGLIDIYQP
ncbi:hypothetical protein TSUD_22150 [Trifolium subterraneum]|uniref:Integrase catalytic domain-containing protein n=1 Tax=Trifolium subterraneum TaxID=3900 RepID=A0A2Z6NJB5_TRISU|nr:hypothetical protein TSUD_22150 [Trifolium subterraneum]